MTCHVVAGQAGGRVPRGSVVHRGRARTGGRKPSREHEGSAERPKLVCHISAGKHDWPLRRCPQEICWHALVQVRVHEIDPQSRNFMPHRFSLRAALGPRRLFGFQTQFSTGLLGGTVQDCGGLHFLGFSLCELRRGHCGPVWFSRAISRGISENAVRRRSRLDPSRSSRLRGFTRSCVYFSSTLPLRAEFLGQFLHEPGLFFCFKFLNIRSRWREPHRRTRSVPLGGHQPESGASMIPRWRSK